MDAASTPSRPTGVVVVVSLTALYGIERLVTDVVAPDGLLLPGPVTIWSGLAAFAVALLLWDRRFLGWAAAIVLYAFWLFDLTLGAMTFGLGHVPLVVVPIATLVYLLIVRERFRTGPSATGPVSDGT